MEPTQKMVTNAFTGVVQHKSFEKWQLVAPKIEGYHPSLPSKLP